MPDLLQIEPQRAFHGCAENEMAALAGRHLLKTPLPEPALVSRAYSRLYKRFRSMKGAATTWTADRVLAARSGQLRRRYEEAYESIALRPLDSEDAKVKMFVKLEKWPASAFAKAPRAIQYRSTRYTAELARRLIPVDKILFRPSSNTHCMKGLNSFERARRLLAMDRWVDTTYIGLDHSKWDAHQSGLWLQAEHSFYCWLNPDPELPAMLRYQRRNKCRSANGIKYVMQDKRCSGDWNTSTGNNQTHTCILEDLLTEALGERFSDWDFVHDGDDGVIATSQRNLHKIANLPKMFLRYGLTTKVDAPTQHIEEVQFCQSRLIRLGDHTARMVRDPYRAISRALTSVKKLAPSQMLSYLASVGACELSCNDGVPVMESFARYVSRHSHGAKVMEDRDLTYRTRLEKGNRNIPITERARASFAVAFAILPGEQLLLEDYFNTSNHDVFVGRTTAALKQDMAYIASVPACGAE